MTRPPPARVDGGLDKVTMLERPEPAPPNGRALPYNGPERRANRPHPVQRWLSMLIDEVDYGMVLLTEDAQVVFINHLARIQLENGHPLEVRGRWIGACRAADHLPFVSALAAAAQRGRRCLLKMGEDAQPAMVSVVPLGQPGQGEPAIALIFGRRQVCEPLSVEAFARTHQLTVAETRVLIALCSGSRVSDVARLFGVEVSTVRSQVSNIRHKTGAKTIAGLVQQVALLPPLIGVLRPAAP